MNTEEMLRQIQQSPGDMAYMPYQPLALLIAPPGFVIVSVQHLIEHLAQLIGIESDMLLARARDLLNGDVIAEKGS